MGRFVLVVAVLWWLSAPLFGQAEPDPALPLDGLHWLQYAGTTRFYWYQAAMDQTSFRAARCFLDEDELVETDDGDGNLNTIRFELNDDRVDATRVVSPPQLEVVWTSISSGTGKGSWTVPAGNFYLEGHWFDDDGDGTLNINEPGNKWYDPLDPLSDLDSDGFANWDDCDVDGDGWHWSNDVDDYSAAVGGDPDAEPGEGEFYAGCGGEKQVAPTSVLLDTLSTGLHDPSDPYRPSAKSAWLAEWNPTLGKYKGVAYFMKRLDDLMRSEIGFGSNALKTEIILIRQALEGEFGELSSRELLDVIMQSLTLDAFTDGPRVGEDTALAKLSDLSSGMGSQGVLEKPLLEMVEESFYASSWDPGTGPVPTLYGLLEDIEANTSGGVGGESAWDQGEIDQLLSDSSVAASALSSINAKLVGADPGTEPVFRSTFPDQYEYQFLPPAEDFLRSRLNEDFTTRGGESYVQPPEYPTNPGGDPPVWVFSMPSLNFAGAPTFDIPSFEVDFAFMQPARDFVRPLVLAIASLHAIFIVYASVKRNGGG